MTQPVYIFLAGPVKGKGRPRFVRSSGRAYTPSQTVNYEAALRLAGQMAMEGRELFEGAVAVRVRADFEIPKSFTKIARREALDGRKLPTKKPDADNVFKVCGDALNGIVWRDDAQITDAGFSKRYAEKSGLSIEVRAA